jgi:hypothetical protein
MAKQNIFCNLLELINSVETQLSKGKGSNQVNPLYEVIKRTCTESLLHRRLTGVTLLFPVDEKYRKGLLDKLESGTASSEDMENLQMEISTLIMPEAVKDGSDLVSSARNKKAPEPIVGPLGNWLGEIYTFEKKGSSYIVKVGNDEIGTISNQPPSDVKVNTFYQSRYQLEFSVWFLTFNDKARFPYDKNSPQKYKFKPTRANKGTGDGGAGVTGGHESYINQLISTNNSRFAIAKQLEADYAKCMYLDKCKVRHPYLIAVTSLLNYLRIKKNDVYNYVLPVLDYDPIISFYILVEPYKTVGKHFISNEDLFENGGYWAQVQLCKSPKDEYLSHFENKFNVSGGFFSEQPRVLAAIQDVRSTIFEIKSYSTLVSRVRAAYTSFSAGTVKGVDHILPSQSVREKDVDRKLWQDEFRFNIAAAIKCLVHRGKFDIGEFEMLIQRIQCGWKGNDYKSDLVVVCEDTKYKIITQAELGLLVGFICSTDFLYIPVSAQNIGVESRSRSDDADGSDYSVYNRNYEVRKMLDELLCDQCDLAKVSQEISDIMRAL